MRAVVMFCIAFLTAAGAFAQGDRSATLTVTVLDESRAVIPSAQVTVVRHRAGEQVDHHDRRHRCAGAGEVRQGVSRALFGHRRVLRISDQQSAGGPDPERREPSGGHAAHRSSPVGCHRLPRSPERGRRSRRHVRDGDDARTDRCAVRRSRRAAAAADGHRGSRREDPRRQLRRARPAAQGA